MDSPTRNMTRMHVGLALSYSQAFTILMAIYHAKIAGMVYATNSGDSYVH